MSKTEAKSGKEGFFTRVGNYFSSSYAELKKVIWPTRKELINHTWVVIVICALFTLFIFLLDIVFKYLNTFLTGTA
jgi:preprotein translocase subunit SecE